MLQPRLLPTADVATYQERAHSGLLCSCNSTRASSRTSIATQASLRRALIPDACSNNSSWGQCKAPARSNTRPSRSSQQPAATNSQAQQTDESVPTDELPWSVESMVKLMEKMVDKGVKADDVPEADWMLAAAVASAHCLSTAQLARLLRAAAELDLDKTALVASASWLRQPGHRPDSSSDSVNNSGSKDETWITFVLRASQGALKDAHATTLLDLLSTVLHLQQQLLLEYSENDESLEAEDIVLLIPDGEWLAAAVTQMASDTDNLSAPAAAGAIIVVTELLSITPSPIEPGPWLDVLLLRMAGSDVHTVPSSDMVACAYLVASTHKHMPPQSFIQALFGDESGACYRLDWEPEEAVALAVASASFRCVPDLLWAKQVHMQTYPRLRDMPAFLLAELVWALGYWQSAKASTPHGRYDYRPPASWWDEWFQATAPLLKSSSPASCIRLVWAAAMLELRPPEQWLQHLVSTIYLHLQAGQHDPLGLLYLTKAGDLWWSQLLDSSNSVAAANRSPPVKPHSTPHSSAARPSPSSSTSSSIVMCGSPIVYEPPDQLSLLVQDTYDCLSRVSMPPLFYALNVRAVPPYALSQSSAEAETGLELGTGQGGQGGEGSAPWQMSAAARRVYGPLPPPPSY